MNIDHVIFARPVALSIAILLVSYHEARSEQLPEITVQAAPHSDGVTSGASAFAPARILDLETSESPAALNQQLIDQGWATWDAANSLGLAQGLQVRGFALSNQGVNQLQASRILLNGHTDIAWRFARDAATLESAQLLGGHDATLLGAGSPGGALLLTSKAPTGAPFFKTQFSAASDVGLRVALDGERHIGPLQLRGVLAIQHGGHTPEGVGNDREAALLSTRLPLSGGGHVQWDMETHRNRMPFPFGTAYAGGRFWLEQAYVDTDRARADRRSWRQAVYLERPLNQGLTLKAHAQAARSMRDETLVGFFDVKNARQLRGYLRQIDENHQQRDMGIQLDGRLVNGSWRNHWTLASLTHTQKRDFSGPQNYTGFMLDLENPKFPADISTIPLAPRFTFEHLRDSGVGLAWRADNGSWDWRLGMRASSLHIDASSHPTKPLAPVTRARPFTHALGLGRKLGPAGRIWVARTQSYQPNRGQFANGDWLPASSGTQWEAGWAWPERDAPATAQRPRLAVTAFDIRRSNLAAADPSTPDAYILRGTQRSRGLELQAAFHTGPLRWDLSATALRACVTEPATADQGTHLPGIAGRFGSVRVQAPVHLGQDTRATAWARVTASSSRPGDAKALFRAPGWVTLDVGLQGHQPGARSLRWGVQIHNLANRAYVRALTGPDNVWAGPPRQLQLWLGTTW